MSAQTLEYIKEMSKMYETIFKRCIDNYILTCTDLLFIDVYKNTIDKNVEVPKQYKEARKNGTTKIDG